MSFEKNLRLHHWKVRYAIVSGNQRDKIIVDKLMYTYPMIEHKITPSLDCNEWLKRLDTQLNEPTYQNLRKVFKVVKR